MTIHLPLKRNKLGRVPWGYRPDDNDPYLLMPIAEQLTVLEKGFDMLDNGASVRKVTNWIVAKTGVSISTTSVMNFYEADESRTEGREKRAKLTENYTANNKIRKYKPKTEEEKAVFEVGRLKTRLTRKQKKLENLRLAQAAAQEELDSVPKPVVEEKPPLTIPAEALKLHEQQNVTQIVPNPGPQTEFLAAGEFEVFFGGSAGPGKTWALNVDPLRTVEYESHRAITFRKSNDDLREVIAMTKEMYPKLVPGAKFSEQKSTWYFPAGGTHWFRYLDRDDDVLSMQGQSFTWAGFDELPQWATPFVYNYIRSRVRTTDPRIRPFLSIRSTGNPGGVGARWVKRMFIDPAPPNTAFPATDVETGLPLLYPPGHEKEGQPLFYRRFIPAKLKDNPHLYNDGTYEAGLLSLPEVQRKQLLDGNWDVAEGAAFEEFDRRVHVCAPFPIPPHWVRFRAADWGYSKDYACCLWFAVDNYQNLYVYRELYVRKMLAPDFGDKILEMEAGENIRYGVLDRHCWDKRGDESGQTIAQSIIARGCSFRRADGSPGSRRASKLEVHRRLQVKQLPDEITGEIKVRPNLQIFNTCVNLIRTLPVIPLDKNNPEDVDTDSEDHAYDALRYGCMSRPLGRAAIQRPASGSISGRRTKTYNKFGFPA